MCPVNSSASWGRSGLVWERDLVIKASIARFRLVLVNREGHIVDKHTVKACAGTLWQLCSNPRCLDVGT